MRKTNRSKDNACNQNRSTTRNNAGRTTIEEEEEVYIYGHRIYPLTNPLDNPSTTMVSSLLQQQEEEEVG